MRQKKENNLYVYKMFRTQMGVIMKNMIYKILIMVIGVLLFVAGVVDIKKKQVSRSLISMLAVMCLGAIFFKGTFGIYDAIGGFTIGVCAIGISIASHDQIGRGDGFVIASLGLLLGFRSCLAAVCVASLIMCIVAVFVLVCKKGSRDMRLPFLPAVFAGYALYAAQILI